MASNINLDLIRGNYARQSDEELLRIISQDAHGLTAEAVQVIKEELARRRLDPELGNVVAAQNKDYTNDELDEIARELETLICPKCHRDTHPLTAAVISQTMSFIIVTQHSTRLHIARPSCLKSECNSSSGITFLLGWWGIPWGPIRSIQSLANNFKAYAAIKETGPNDFMREFIRANIGLMEMHKNNREGLQTIVYNLQNNGPVVTDRDV